MACASRRTVAIIGAGPYGLSVAAHLLLRDVDVRVFGEPMENWKTRMPEGMFLKSEGCASNLSGPGSGYTLQEYCAAKSVPYAPHAHPVSLDVFTNYGLAFQRRLVPSVERSMVTALDKGPASFELSLETGETLVADKVVIATGLSYSDYVPPPLRHLPSDVLSHSSAHHVLSGFNGRNVTVVGAGQSALETAALLNEAGAQVRILARRNLICWNREPSVNGRPIYQRLRHPMSPLGPGYGPWFYSYAPAIFHRLPRNIRVARVRHALGPAGAAWLRNRVEGRIPVLTGHYVVSAEMSGARPVLHTEGPNHELSRLATDHVIAATGYRFTHYALPFLSQRLQRELSAVLETPILSRYFESSVPGLYFTGLATATQFGPAMRFLVGADFTARRIAGHIAGGRRASQRSISCAA